MLNVALVGAGRMARLHAGALRKIGVPHRVVGVCDVSESAALALARATGASVYRTMSDLLARERPDIVHVCTPAGAHFEPAREALESGAHVYVEKPFVETERDARTLVEEAGRRHLLVCAGHQLLRHPAYERLIRDAQALRPIAHVDSAFNFRPVGLRVDAAGPGALAAQLLDVLPHPLYTLVAALERAGGTAEPVRVVAVHASAADLFAQLGAAGVAGRLAVSLRARPVSSTLTLAGAGGSLTADFVRGIVVGTRNPGTEPLEKVLNPLREAGQLAARSLKSAARRALSGGDDPGLVGILKAFYTAVHQGGRAPVSPDQLLSVTRIYEELAANVRSAVRADVPTARRRSVGGPVAVVTGARGWLGKAIARRLARRGYHVRGVSRVPDDTGRHVNEWIAADLAVGLPAEVLAGAEVVVHAAAETSGGYDAHRRNTVDATRNLIQAMANAGVGRLVHVSSLSVLRPPRTPWEVQDEATPLADDARPLGAYTWGKCEAEKVVRAEAERLGVDVRIVRPGALVDWARAELPGLVGRRLFGRWHLGFGRPGMPVAVCEVGEAGAVIAWCAACFETAPAVLNLMDEGVPTRSELLRRFRHWGWSGRMLWVPISALAFAVGAARLVSALAHGRWPAPLSLWSILRARRYDVARSSLVRQAAALEGAAAPAVVLP
jgi:predicted dehydrogenase